MAKYKFEVHYNGPTLENNTMLIKDLAPSLLSLSEVYLQIVNGDLEYKKWKFSNGSNQFFADIVDEVFLQVVKKNKQFFDSTDLLKVKLQTVQSLDTSGKLKSAYTVLKVLDHIKGSEQIELDLFDHDEEKKAKKSI